MAALTPNFNGCKPDNKLYVSFVFMILWLFYKYADLKPIGIRRVQFIRSIWNQMRLNEMKLNGNV